MSKTCVGPYNSEKSINGTHASDKAIKAPHISDKAMHKGSLCHKWAKGPCQTMAVKKP